MDETRIEVVREWFVKAEHDLGAARFLDATDYTDVIVYHCQQTAEKAIKGFLTYFDIPFPKTHNVRSLLELAAKIEPAICSYAGIADRLTRYATAYRYPDLDLDLERAEVDEALNNASILYHRILACLPEQVRPCEGPSSQLRLPGMPGEEAREAEA